MVLRGVHQIKTDDVKLGDVNNAINRGTPYDEYPIYLCTVEFAI